MSRRIDQLRLSDAEVYKKLLQMKACNYSSSKCDRQCENCSMHVNKEETCMVLYRAIELVKARCPELYLVDDLQVMKQILAQNNSRYNEEDSAVD